MRDFLPFNFDDNLEKPKVRIKKVYHKRLPKEYFERKSNKKAITKNELLDLKIDINLSKGI